MSSNQETNKLVTHQGSCHCGKVEWEVDAEESVVVWRCSCSICRMKGNDHFIVPRSRFRLLKGESYLTTYTFNTHRAKHKFCKICGVQSFYHPRSNPDGIGIKHTCVTSKTIKNVKIVKFDGKNWEKSFVENDAVISPMSKL